MIPRAPLVSPFGLVVGLLVSLTLTAVATAQSSAARLLSVEELELSQSKYVDLNLRVEGRLMLVGKDRIWLRNSPIQFRTVDGMPDLSDVPRRSLNVELAGVLREREGKLVFEIRSVTPRPGDLDAFQQRRQKLLTDPAEWRALGDWARQRGQFYRDQELLNRSAEAYRRAVDLQRLKLGPDDIDGLLRLAGEAQLLELPGALQQELRHEAYHHAWRQRAELAEPALSRLLADMERDLPGSTRPLPALDGDLAERYRERPVAVYAASNAESRESIHRLLYADVLLESITRRLAEDGSNLFELAALLDEKLPEQHALAESYRDRALALRAAVVSKLPRKDVLALAEEYRARQQPDQADGVIESWLTLRRRRLEEDDLEGVLQLAEDFRTLLKRGDAADRLLLDAARRHPNARELADALQRQGYRRVNGLWLTAGEEPPEDPRVRALREGRIERGMTGAQVRQSLGEPTRIARSASSGQVSEVWLFGDKAATLAIQLTKRRLQPELTVIRVLSLSATPRAEKED